MYSFATTNSPMLPSVNANALNITVKYIRTKGRIFFDKKLSFSPKNDPPEAAPPTDGELI